MLISIINAKGGSGKSTLAVHLAAYLADVRHQRVALLDADGQGTASAWLAEACPGVHVRQVRGLGPIENAARELVAVADVVVADGPAGLADETAILAGVSDLAAIPVAPSVADLRGAQRTVELIKRVQARRDGLPFAITILNRRRPTRLSAEVAEALPTLGLPVARASIGLRDVIADASGQGCTVFQLGAAAAVAAEEFIAVCREIWHHAVKA